MRSLPSGVVTAAILFAILSAALLIGLNAGDKNIGKNAPEIAGKTATGETFQLANQKGKIVLVNFWATWCGPCQMEIPDMIALQNRFGSEKFLVVGVSADDHLETAASFAKQAKINYPILLANRDMLMAYNVQAFPTSFILDKQGNVTLVQEGYGPGATERFIKEIERLL